MTLKLLILFPTTYGCKKAFSTLLTIKSKSRNKENVTHDSCPSQQREIAERQESPSISLNLAVVNLRFFFNKQLFVHNFTIPIKLNVRVSQATAKNIIKAVT